MRARELAQPFATVGLEDSALEAARAMAEAGRPGIVVLGEDGTPWTVLPGSQVLRLAIPTYVQEDPHLARVYDEKAADDLFARLEGKVVRDLVPEHREQDELPVVDPDATSIEVAAVMARMRSPLAVVSDGDDILGVVTVSRLLRALLPKDA
ncbi:MAG TPA: CBS domain-containing protein [Pedococcus sp.]|jgi:CBS domain-containing protein|nr:CBS domain-containing protein [Pedococcus sp.]